MLVSACFTFDVERRDKILSRYLITGASGFLGSILVNELELLGHDLVLVDRQIKSAAESKHLAIECDLSSSDSIETVVDTGPFDAIFHLASQIDFNVQSQGDLFQNNVSSTQVVTEIARQTGCRKFVFTSSNSVFLGHSGSQPIRQNDPPSPTDEYGRSKVKSEEIISSNSDAFDFIIFRCPNILDAGRVGMLSIFFDFVLEGRKCWLVGDGSSRYQSLYSRDLITAMLQSLELKGSYTFNIGSDNVPSIFEMYQAVISRSCSKAKVGHLPTFPTIPMLKILNRLHLSPIGPYQFRMLTADFTFDCSYVKTVLNWRPTLDNTEMLCRAFDFYKNHKDDLDNNRSANSGKVSQGIISVLRRLS